MVLREFGTVVGYEREPALLEHAAFLLPGIEFTSVESLDRLPIDEGTFDFVMTFTVLQHMRDAEALSVLGELKRVARSGFILLVEETDSSFIDGNPSEAGTGVTIGRSIETYSAWMKPHSLALQFPREIEPGYPRSDVGSYMLFQP